LTNTNTNTGIGTGTGTKPDFVFGFNFGFGSTSGPLCIASRPRNLPVRMEARGLFRLVGGRGRW
jgi:hypothetical protein